MLPASLLITVRLIIVHCRSLKALLYTSSRLINVTLAAFNFLLGICNLSSFHEVEFARW